MYGVCCPCHGSEQRNNGGHEKNQFNYKLSCKHCNTTQELTIATVQLHCSPCCFVLESPQTWDVYMQMFGESTLLRYSTTRRWLFLLQRPALIQNTTPTKNLGIPTFRPQNRPIKIPPTYFGLDVPFLEILPSEDMPSMSTNSSMPFHNVDPKLLHCFS